MDLRGNYRKPTTERFADVSEDNPSCLGPSHGLHLGSNSSSLWKMGTVFCDTEVLTPRPLAGGRLVGKYRAETASLALR